MIFPAGLPFLSSPSNRQCKAHLMDFSSYRSMYEEESVRRPQMVIKLNTCDIRTWRKNLFLDISSTNVNTHFSSLYQCVETLNIEVLDCCLRHIRNSTSTFKSSVKISCPVVNCFIRQTIHTVNRKHFFMNILCIETFCP
jgi:hypothetical protein